MAKNNGHQSFTESFRNTKTSPLYLRNIKKKLVLSFTGKGSKKLVKFKKLLPESGLTGAV